VMMTTCMRMLAFAWSPAHKPAKIPAPSLLRERVCLFHLACIGGYKK